MEEYCINLSSCRRKLFFEKFSDPSDLQSRRQATFKECGSMCDNCSSKQGGQRRTFNQGGGSGYQALPIDLSGGGGGGGGRYGYSGAGGASAANSNNNHNHGTSSSGTGRAGFTTASGRAVQVRGYSSNTVDTGDDDKDCGGRGDRWNSRGTGQIVVVDGAINVDSDDDAPSSSTSRRGHSGQQQAQAQKARIIPAKEMYMISERARKQDNDDEHVSTSNSSSLGKAMSKQQQSQGSLNSFIVPKNSSISSSSLSSISLVDGSLSKQIAILPPRPTDFSLSRSRGAVVPPRPKTTNSIINSGITGTAAAAAATIGHSTGAMARKNGAQSDGSCSGSQSTRIMGSSYNSNGDSMTTVMLADDGDEDALSVSSSRNGREHSRERSRVTSYGEEVEFDDTGADDGWVPPRQKKPRSND